MTAEQALQIVENVFASVQANKATYAEPDKALQVLKEMAAKNDAKKPVQ